jgi:hypothetical protein
VIDKSGVVCYSKPPHPKWQIPIHCFYADTGHTIRDVHLGWVETMLYISHLSEYSEIAYNGNRWLLGG